MSFFPCRTDAKPSDRRSDMNGAEKFIPERQRGVDTAVTM